MYNRNQFLDKNAKNTLEGHKLEQQERKLRMEREQKMREMKALETQLFYKLQEVKRLKALCDRLKREAVLKEQTTLRETRELQTDQRQVKETEEKLHHLDQEIQQAVSDISAKIEKEKAAVLEHQRNVESLEKEKKNIEIKKEREKKSFMESMSRLLFFKKRDEQESVLAVENFKTSQNMLHSTEASLKQFTQEVTVLENKIRALHTTIR